MHKKHCAFFMMCCLATAALMGCTLPEVDQTGSACPPPGQSGNLDYINLNEGISLCTENAICYDESFEFKRCPLQINECHLDKNSKFYCSKSCTGRYITCEGKCIDPNESEEFCGAVNSCKDNNEGFNCCTGYTTCNQWQECYRDPTNPNATPFCREKPCTNDETRCIPHTEGGYVTEICNGGTWKTHEICAKDTQCNADQKACEAPVNCIYKGQTINDGESICDNDVKPALAIKCQKTELIKTICPNDEKSELAGVCKLEQNNASCTVPTANDCILGNTIIKHNESICEDNNVRFCFNGTLDVTSCPPMHAPDLTACHNGNCELPRNCSNRLNHLDYTCNNTKLMQCNDGQQIEIQDCAKNTDGNTACDKGKCVTPNYNSINALHKDYKILINQETCNAAASPEGDRPFDNARPANVTVEGVVTALRTDKLGFVIQEPSLDGKQAGIYVYCQGKDCMKYSNTDDDIQVGDNIKITSDGVGHYYCQMQIRSYQTKLIIEKTDKNEKIAPVIVHANNINTAEANNPYYGSLVTIERFTTGTDKQTKPNGWPGVDENNAAIIVNNGLDTNTINAMEPQKTYQVTGIVNWAFNNDVLVPRSNEDIVFLPNCDTNETSIKCLKTAGSIYLTTCTDGQENLENCTLSNKECDADNAICRQKAICNDKTNQQITENHTSCFVKDGNEYIGKCIYQNGTPTWDIDNALHCPHACNNAKTACNHAPLDNCQYLSIDKDTHQSTVRVNVPKGAEITTQIYCTTDLSKPILEWPFSTEATVNPNCTDCTETDTIIMTEYVTKDADMPASEGKHYCVAIASVKDGNQYLCKPTGGTPDVITNSTQTSASYAQTYNVTRPLLAEWNFDDSNLTIDGGAVTSATFALVNAGGKTPTFNGGTNGQAVAIQAKWSENATPNYISDPHWEIKIDTTGYKNIAVSFSVRASGKNSKSFALAYKTADTFTHVGTDLTFIADQFHAYPPTLLPNADNKSNVTIGIFPYATASTPNVRIDDVRVYGDII